MRKLGLSVLLLAIVTGIGAFYFYEDIFGDASIGAESVAIDSEQPVPMHAIEPIQENAPVSPVYSQEQVPQVVPQKAPATQLEEEKIPEQKVAPVQEQKAPAPQVQPKSAKPAKKPKDSLKAKPKDEMITLPIEDNLRIKERKRPGTLGYKHWTGWYYPTKFILTINDKQVITFDGKEFTRPTKELTFNPKEPLKAHFVWEFLNGRKAGWRSTDFQLMPEAKSIYIGFDWKDQWQVIIDQAAPITKSDKSSDNKNVEKR